MAEASELSGKVVDGRYVLDTILGRGGMGAVYRARHRYTGADVALKLLHPALSMDAELRRRFLAEARTPNAIGHAGIAAVLDAGMDPDGSLYIAMELLAGRSLRQAAYGRRLAPEEIRRIGLGLLDPLAAAHAHNVIHRDLKPENVFLVGPGANVKLLDFGIAKLIDAGLSQALTATGVLLGTVAYMSPEQLQDAARVDARTDVWAVGAILYELLTGRLPYAAGSQSVATMLVALTTQEPEPIRLHWPAIDAATESFFARALSRDRAGRFASAAEMAAALAALPFAAGPIPAWAPVAQSGSTLATGHPSAAHASVAAPGASTIATGYPSAAHASVAALHALPAASFVPPAIFVAPPIAPTMSIAAPVARRRIAPWIAAGVAGAIVAGTIGYFAVRPTDDAPTSAKALRAAPEPDDPAATPVPSSESRPLPKGTPVAPTLSVAEDCERGCRTAALCKMVAGDEANCVSACKASPDTFRCMREHDSCQEIAICGVEATCSVAPHGTRSCRDTMQCTLGCSTAACSCDCMAEARAAELVEVFRATICVVTCLKDRTCIETRCNPTTCLGA